MSDEGKHMAKKRGNKSESIRLYLEKQPDASSQEIAKALKVKPSLVYSVRANMQKNGRRTVGKKKTRKARVTAGKDRSSEPVVAAARLIKVCGGAAEARHALHVAEQVVAMLQD
jgi:Mn-dependent DtxR family transcriptional regulator